MKIKSFSVKNFRSITSTNELPLYDFSILLGPNNEGKSNILKAFVMAQNLITDPIAMQNLIEQARYARFSGRQIVTRRYSRRRMRGFEEDDQEYNWVRDFPIKLQKNKKDAFTVFTTVYELSTSEKTTFKKTANKILSGNLKFSISINLSGAKLDISDTNYPKKK